MTEDFGAWRWLLAFKEASPDAIIGVDSAGRIALVSACAEALFGSDARDLIGSPIQRILPDLSIEHSGDPPYPPIEIEGRRSDASRFRARVSLTPLGDLQLAIVLDRTDETLGREERLDLEARERLARSLAEHAEEVRDHFLATLSHELRTPLNAMLGWTQILRTHPNDSEVGARAVDTIERNVRLQARLIEDLLDVTNLASGKLFLDLRPVSLIPILEAAIERVTPEIEAKSITMTRDLAADTPDVVGDPRRLEQIGWNLLANAVAFTPQRGTVRLTLRPAGSQVEIRVADNGEGIAPAVLPHLFDRFRQAGLSSQRRHLGLGLGLSIVKGLVELHGGDIQAESPGTGSGATFIVRIPRLSSGAPELTAGGRVGSRAQSLTREEMARRIRGVRVLVVDDEPDLRESFRQILADFGAQVVVAGSASAALDAIEAHHPQVMLCDIGMPEGDGYQLIRKVRSLARRQDREIRAAALTAFTGIQDRARAIESGFQMFLAKPVEAMRLGEAVARLAMLPR